MPQEALQSPHSLQPCTLGVVTVGDEVVFTPGHGVHLNLNSRLGNVTWKKVSLLGLVTKIAGKQW